MAQGRSTSKKGTKYNAAATDRAMKAAKAAFAEFSAIAENLVEEALVEGALLVERQAKRYVPVDTGRLRGSISHRLIRGPDGPYAEIGSNIEYAIWTEFGTGIYAANGQGRKTPWAYTDSKGETRFTWGNKPTFFLTRAYEENKGLIQKRIQRAIKKAEEEAARNAPKEEIEI